MTKLSEADAKELIRIQRARAMAYCYGVMDTGRPLRMNDVEQFADAWAEAQWEFAENERASLPPFSAALKSFLEEGEIAR